MGCKAGVFPLGPQWFPRCLWAPLGAGAAQASQGHLMAGSSDSIFPFLPTPPSVPGRAGEPLSSSCSHMCRMSGYTWSGSRSAQASFRDHEATDRLVRVSTFPLKAHANYCVSDTFLRKAGNILTMRLVVHRRSGASALENSLSPPTPVFLLPLSVPSPSVVLCSSQPVWLPSHLVTCGECLEEPR